MQKKVALNRVMIGHLNEVVGLSMRALCHKMDIPVNTLTNWTKQGTIRVRDLVQLCNIFHIPFREFLTFETEDDTYRTISSIAIPKEDFKRVVFRYERIRQCGRLCTPPMKMTDISDGMGISFNKLKKFYSEEEANNFTVDDFLLLCSVTRLPISYFLQDPSWMGDDGYETSYSSQEDHITHVVKEEDSNELAPSRSIGREEESSRSKEHSMLLELLEENRKLHKLMESLSEKNQQLSEQISRMSAQVEGLSDRIDKLESERKVAASEERKEVEPGKEETIAGDKGPTVNKGKIETIQGARTGMNCNRYADYDVELMRTGEDYDYTPYE